MRALVYGMPSSGASLFTCLLAQSPGSVAVVDHYGLAPSLQIDFPVILKVTISCEVSFEDHCRVFKPDRRILFLRNPYDTYQSLSAKHYKDLRGTVLEKLRVLNHAFARRSGLFDIVVTYEDLIRDPEHVLALLRAAGFELSSEALRFPRTPQQIARFAIENSDWCRNNYLERFGFGNIHFMEWGTLKEIRYPRLSEDDRVAVCAACPQVDAYYSALRNRDLAQPIFIESKTSE